MIDLGAKYVKAAREAHSDAPAPPDNSGTGPEMPARDAYDTARSNFADELEKLNPDVKICTLTCQQTDAEKIALRNWYFAWHWYDWDGGGRAPSAPGQPTTLAKPPRF